MLGWADSSWLRATAYLLVAALCPVAARRDQRQPWNWSAFWPLTALLLLAMAVGRAGNVAAAVTDLLRDRATHDGWYRSRRGPQTAAVSALVCVWLTVVLTATWRIPERRRRYLPVVVAVVTLAAFVAVRAVSLHDVDAVLHRRHVAGMRVGTLIEYALVGLTGLILLWPIGLTERGARQATPVVRG